MTAQILLNAGMPACMVDLHASIHVMPESNTTAGNVTSCRMCVIMAALTSMHNGVEQAVSSTLDILRTPMPFGSPVPDPSRPTSLGQAFGENTGQKRTTASRTGYANLLYTVPFELR